MTSQPQYLRLQSALQAWKDIGAPPVIISWIQHGYRLPFVKDLPPFSQSEWVPSTQEESQALRQMLQDLLSLGVLKPVHVARYISRARLEPKSSGGFRLVVDLRFVNAHLKPQPVHYEDLGTLPQMIQPDDFMFSFDLQNGYYHIPIHPAHRQFLTVRMFGALYQFQCLPFGLSTAPMVFTKVMRPLVAALRASGMTLLPYLDDFLVLARSENQALAHRRTVEVMLTQLGLQRNPKKGFWTPVQRLTHLGLDIDSVLCQFSVPPAKLRTLKASATSIIAYAKSHRRWASTPRLQSLLGFAQSLRMAIPLVPMYLRQAYSDIAARKRTSEDTKLSHQSLKDLQWLADLQPQDTVAKIIRPQPSLQIATDASDFAWGASVSQPSLMARGFWDQSEVELHINIKELLAVERAIDYFHRPLQGQSAVSMLIDSQVIVSILRRKASRSPRLMQVLRRILPRMAALGVELQPTWIPSKENSQADMLSRLTEAADWRFSPKLFQRMVLQQFPDLTVDLFASPGNRLLPRFCSWVPAPHSLGDAFQLDWTREVPWVNPPWPLIPRVLARLAQCQGRAVLCLPYWRSAPWFPVILQHVTSMTVLPPQLVAKVVERTNPAVPEPLRNPRWSLMIAHLQF